MIVEILDGATIREFVEDESTFADSMKDRFARLDTNHDGLLSYTEMAEELRKLKVLETHFGSDGAGLSQEELVGLYPDGDRSVNLEEFKEEMREVMLAIANGIGEPILDFEFL